MRVSLDGISKKVEATKKDVSECPDTVAGKCQYLADLLALQNAVTDAIHAVQIALRVEGVKTIELGESTQIDIDPDIGINVRGVTL